MKKKVLLLLAVATICFACVVGSTVAWVRGQASITNTFTIGNVTLSLFETSGRNYQLIPGTTVVKNPTVTVHRGSTDCWLFVRIEESADLDNYISYTPADGWLPLGTDGVYYRLQEAVTADVTYSVLLNDSITVKDTVNNTSAAALKAQGIFPTLKITAYAIQQSGIATAEEAWQQVSNQAITNGA